MTNKLDDIINNTICNETMECQRCKEKIVDPAYIVVSGNIINTTNSAKIFTCPEQVFNYGQVIVMHTCCWIELLREYGSKLYDMGEVAKRLNRERKEELVVTETEKDGD